MALCLNAGFDEKTCENIATSDINIEHHRSTPMKSIEKQILTSYLSCEECQIIASSTYSPHTQD